MAAAARKKRTGVLQQQWTTVTITPFQNQLQCALQVLQVNSQYKEQALGHEGRESDQVTPAIVRARPER